ncbi:MAG: hypothetical protein V5A66_03515 [Candidatus Thermoplasmatota archaeon]
MDINQDVYDSLVYQTRIADLDLGDGEEDLYPPSPYLVYGTVEDDEGDPVVKTNVTIENLDTKETIYTYTDINGYYELNFGNFVEEGYDSSDIFSIRAGSFSTNFTIGDEWGQRKDLDVDIGADVPNWGVGSNWDYEQDIWMDQSDGGWLMMNESITYTVADIGYHDYNGSTYYSYNLSLEGDIQDGEGEFDGYPIEIEDGKIEGYMLLRVSDLGVIVDHQYREIDGYVDTWPNPDFDAFVNLTRCYQTVVEEYDFPLRKDETFWANTTVETFGDYYFGDEYGYIEEEDEFSELQEINQTNQVRSELKNVEVPAGSYTTYEVNATMENETSQLGYMNNWYNETVGWFVKQSSKFPSDEFEADVERELTDSALKTPNHTQEIKPNPQYIGRNITLSGCFEGYGNTALSIYIPYSLGKQNWTVETDSNGNYELTFQVPHIEDNTPTHSYYSSEGIIISLEDNKSEKIVSTLVVKMETYELDINSTEGGEVVEPGEDTFTYEYGTELYLEAVVEDNYHFVGWTGDIDKINDPEAQETKIKMSDNYSITAEFAIDTYELTVQSTEGGEVIDSGERTFEYDHGETVSLEAVADDYYHFTGWTGDTGNIDDTTSNATTITMMNNYTIIAEFEEEVYDLTIETSDNGTVTSPGEDTFTYEYGTEVALEAVPDEGYRFVGWTGDIGGIADIEDNETKILMRDDCTITAKFEEELVEHELTINVEGNGTVKVEWDNKSHSASAEKTFLIEEGTEVNLTADPDENYEFVEWNGYVEEDEEMTISLDEDMEITAHFSEEQEEGNEDGGATPGFTLPLLLLGAVMTMMIYYKKER